jgi:hypothetical protein
MISLRAGNLLARNETSQETISSMELSGFCNSEIVVMLTPQEEGTLLSPLSTE